MEKTFDCIVIGAGPGGLTTAVILADEGYKVAVVDKETFPRYKIGESMIPFNYFPLKRIGMIEKMQASDFPKKYSVQFVSRTGKQSQPFYFFEHMDHPCSQTWQVTRDVYDNMMLEHAREHGVEVFEAMPAQSLIEEDGRTAGVTCVDSQGQTHTFKATITVDASGGRGIAMKHLSWCIFDENLVKVAIWGYFRGGKRDSGIDEGATTITYLEEKHWAWYIPLQDDIISVGIVGDKEYLYQDTHDLGAIFDREVKKNVWIEQRLQPATLEGDHYVCVHRAYRSKYCAKDGLVLVGDALSFIDPVFSTGMYLALHSGALAADAILEGLKKNDVSGSQFVSYGEEICRRIEILRRLVYAFYSKNFSFKEMVMKYPDLKGAITDCLIGNLDQDFSKLNEALSEFLDLPEPISHGRAKV